MFSLRANTSSRIPSLIRSSLNRTIRTQTTLPQNSHIYIFPASTGHLLTLLSTHPPTEKLAIGTTSVIPVTPDSFTSNPTFNSILDDVLAKYATQDPGLKAQAQGFVSAGVFNGKGEGRGGWVHLSDDRQVPDFGRIAWPEDIFGSVEVDARGEFVEGGWQRSGTYRVVTREGILGLSPFLRGKLIERLREEERKG